MVLLERVRDPAPDLLHLRRVRERNVLRAPHDDRFQPLRTHDRSEPGAASDVLVIVDDPRDLHEVLAGGADLADAREPLPDLGFERVFRVHDLEAPQVCRVAYLDRVVLDVQVHGRARDSRDHDPVPAAALELRAPEAADLRFTEGAGERRLRPDRVAGCARERRTGEHAHREDEDVLGTERVGALGNLAEEVLRDHRAPAGVAAECRLVHLRDGRRARRQVGAQDPAP